MRILCQFLFFEKNIFNPIQYINYQIFKQNITKNGRFFAVIDSEYTGLLLTV